MRQNDDSQDALPLFGGDDSYQGPPAADFENSRGAGIAAFKNGIGLDGSLSGGKRSASSNKMTAEAQHQADNQQQGSLWNAWQDASSSGGSKPVDFSFLMSSTGGASFQPAGAEGDVCMSPETKRGRLHVDKDSGGYAHSSASHDSAAASGSPREGDDHGSPVGFCVGGSAPSGPRKQLTPPQPPKKPKEVFFGRVPDQDRGPQPMDPPIKRVDVFAWLRDDSHDDPDVKALLHDENTYANGMQDHLEQLRQVLYTEMMGHQREADSSLLTPYPGGYGYYIRTFVGKSYQAHYRRKSLDGSTSGSWGDEELVLDENELAVDPSDGSQRPYCSVSGPYAKPDHQVYACGVDHAGSDSYTLMLFSLPRTAGQWQPLKIESTDGSVIWAPRGEGFYYVRLDDEKRPYRVMWHKLGDDPLGIADSIVFDEPDKRFSVSMTMTGCRRFLLISADSSETSEAHLLDLRPSVLDSRDAPAPGAPGTGSLRRVLQRAFGHHYSVDHREGWVYVLTDKDCTKNLKLCRVSLAALPDAAVETWEDVWVPGVGVKLDSHHCFRDFVVLQGREQGECRIIVSGYNPDDSNSVPLHNIAFPDAAAHCGHVLTPRGATAARATFIAGLCGNEIFEAKVIRYSYSSFTLPSATYEYDVRSRDHRLVHRQEVPNFDAGRYRAERIVTPLRKVPISLVYRKDIHPKGLVGGPFPVLLTGYGAYGCCQDPDFDGNRLSLLDRGVVYALAHVRGGGELGRAWYEDGRYTNVKNRFADFVDAAETLISLRIAETSRLAAWGTSSGGLLVTASMNLRPDLFRAVLLEVPFVDALNTMSDPSIPLTVGEWEEVGNPNEREYFYYMLEYSPYDNIRMEAYPAALVTASLNDSMVGYWEPLKYVSKLRLLRTDERPVLLKTNFHAGHGATSDRYEGTREAAFHFAFLLDELGLGKTLPMR